MNNNNHILRRIEEWTTSIILGIFVVLFLHSVQKWWKALSVTKKRKIKNEFKSSLKITFISTIIFFIILALIGKLDNYFQFLDSLK